VSAKDDVISFIRRHDDFLVASHINPDGDAIGSALALSFALDSLGKKNIVYNRDGVPEMLKFLPRGERVLSSLAHEDVKGRNLILLDCSAPERASLEGLSFNQTAVIDHHLMETVRDGIRWTDSESPATGLMVFELIKDLGVAVTRDMAQNLYAAIAVDTGTFRFPNTTPEVLKAAAELVEAGADPAEVADNLYQAWNRNRLDLLLKSLESSDMSNHIAVSVITEEMFTKTGTDSTDTENFVNFPLQLHDIKVSALIRETKNENWKISIRSKGDINVSRVAMRFGGGGHMNAAGCNIKGELGEVKRKLLSEIKKLPGVAG
jgi:phosphoesterase RecJ-like protein